MTAAAGAPDNGQKADGSHGRGRHAPVKGRRRWPWVVVAVVAIMAVVATVGIVLFRDEAEAIVADGCTGSAALRISAAPAIASSLKGVADDFDSWVEDRAGVPCTTTEITAASPQEVAESVGQALDGNAENAPTTWVPDSSLWRSVLARDPRLASVLPRNYPVVAATPVVFAAPRPMAEALGWPDTQPSWEQLSALAANPAGWSAVKHPEWGKVNLQWPDPLTSTAGLGSTVAVYRDLAIGAEATDDLRRRLVTAHNAVNGATGNLSGALAALRASGASAPGGLKDLPIVPATEQEVVAFNADKPAVEVAAIYPTEGWVVSEVPVLALNGSWVSDEQRAASEAFADFVVGGKAQQALQTAGWRAARLDTTVTPAAGVVPTEPEYTPAQPSQDVLARTLQNWTALDRRGSLLVVLDTSGSMKEEAGTTGKSRLQVAKDAVLASLPFFSDQARVGLWTFSRAARGNDYRAVVRSAGSTGSTAPPPRATTSPPPCPASSPPVTRASTTRPWQPWPQSVRDGSPDPTRSSSSATARTRTPAAPT